MPLAAMVTVVLVVSNLAGAEPLIDVGVHVLLPDTPGQRVTLWVSSSDGVAGFNLRAQIGDGLGPKGDPVFESVDFSRGIWSAYPSTTMGGPLPGAEQYAQASVAINAASTETVANGVLVTLVIDTTGFLGAGDFALSLSGTDIGADSDFVLTGGQSLAPTVLNGTIRIAPLSERMAGDADCDGRVDLRDLGALAQGYGVRGTEWSGGDLNLDGSVDYLDYLILKANFGTSAPGSIPEPATIGLLFLAALAFLKPRRLPCH